MVRRLEGILQKLHKVEGGTMVVWCTEGKEDKRWAWIGNLKGCCKVMYIKGGTEHAT